jgi:anti-anti-sigma factor
MTFDIALEATGLYLHLSNSSSFNRELVNAIKPKLEDSTYHHDQNWFIDLTAIRFIDSIAVGFLLVHALKLKKNNKKLYLQKIHPELMKTLHAMNLAVVMELQAQ